MKETWIWLPEDRYPQRQTTRICSFDGHWDEGHYTVAEFTRDYSFDKEIASVVLRFSGDTTFDLYCNDRLVSTGPTGVGGDFVNNEKPRANYYATQVTLCPGGNSLSFYARVKMMPVRSFDFSKAHGGFMLSGQVTFTDGSTAPISTDESWLVRYNGAYTQPVYFDGRIQPDEYVPAQVTENIWNTETAPIPPRVEYPAPIENNHVRLDPHQETTVVMPLDLIHGGYLYMAADGEGVVTAGINFRELEEDGDYEEVILCGKQEYKGLELHSAGNLLVYLRNDSDTPTQVDVDFIVTHYPVTGCAVTETDDPLLNKVLAVCAHTLKVCRQTIHLDSPRHCEPLACTGDYYIASLMTAFSYGDMTLASFDVVRTACLLEQNDGRMFHTSYSLIWARMLHDVYRITGDRALLSRCKQALDLLLNRFASYVGDTGLIETPPDYMFVDWVYADGHSMHHPPKALGQTCLNLFYFDALKWAGHVYAELGRADDAALCQQKRETLRTAINTQLYDAQRGLYCEGLNTPTPEHLISHTMPQNTDKQYFRMQANILAAYTGVCDDETGRAILKKIMENRCDGDYQPYFAHYLLEGIYRLGMRDTYTMPVLDRWRAPVLECDKGLVEGFIPPQQGYGFDHSHAWGGTPLYSLPRALTGLEILQPAYREIALSPSLLGLKKARVELPTPYGLVVCELEEGQEPRITCPEEITLHLR